MPCTPRAPAGLTLLELLLVIAIVSILAAIVLPDAQPAVHDQLRSTAWIVATDLAYARSLAVANNSNYRVVFDLEANRYVMKHSGTNPSLDKLPKSSFSSPGDPPDAHIVDLDELPHVGQTVRLAAVATTGSVSSSTDNVEFGPLGQTTSADPTTVWLTSGSEEGRRYITVVVNPVTGLVEVGDSTIAGPPSGITQVP